jgi:hypothetical protein
MVPFKLSRLLDELPAALKRSWNNRVAQYDQIRERRTSRMLKRFYRRFQP